MKLKERISTIFTAIKTLKSLFCLYRITKDFPGIDEKDPDKPKLRAWLKNAAESGAKLAALTTTPIDDDVAQYAVEFLGNDDLWAVVTKIFDGYNQRKNNQVGDDSVFHLEFSMKKPWKVVSAIGWMVDLVLYCDKRKDKNENF